LKELLTVQNGGDAWRGKLPLLCKKRRGEKSNGLRRRIKGEGYVKIKDEGTGGSDQGGGVAEKVTRTFRRELAWEQLREEMTAESKGGKSTQGGNGT